MGNTMRLGCRRTFFRKPDCLTSKLYGHIDSFLINIILFSLVLLNLACLETQSIAIHTDKCLVQLCYLELSLLSSEYSFAYHSLKRGFCLVEIWYQPLVIDHLQHLPCIKLYCIFSLGLLIETFRYGSPPHVDERHRHRYEVLHQYLFLNILLVFMCIVIICLELITCFYFYLLQVNPSFVPMLESAGLHFVGCDESRKRMEVLSKQPYAILGS